MRHRTALVTAVSAVVVVLAGVSALGVNLGVFASGSGDVSSTTVPEVSAAPSTAAAPSVETEVFTVAPRPPTAPVTLAGEGDVPVPAPAPAAEPVAFEIPGVGLVTASFDGSSLSLVGVDAPGWAWDLVEQGGRLAVVFRSGDSTIRFVASVSGGEITVDVVDETTVTASADRGSYDDEDDDEYEDEHEDDHDEHEDDHDEHEDDHDEDEHDDD